MNDKNEEIVFFDGVCGLCDSFVQWVAKRDTKRRFAFAPLQGETAKGLLDSEFISKLDGMAYHDGQKTWYKSTAALKIIEKLPNWGWVGVVLLLPEGLRNFGYRIIAKNRYKWFGKKQVCDISFRAKGVRVLG